MQSILIQLPTELKSKQSVFLLDAATASNTNTALKIAERLPRQKHEVVDNNSALLSHSVRSPMQPASRRASDEKALSAAVVVVPWYRRRSQPINWAKGDEGPLCSRARGRPVLRSEKGNKKDEEADPSTK